MNETVEFTNLCMVRDGDRVLVIDRKKTEKFDGELISSEEGEVWWEDLKELPNLDLSLDMEDMLRIFLEEDLSEFFYYQDGEDWKYDLK